MRIFPREGDGSRRPTSQSGQATVALFEPGVEIEGKLKASAGTIRLNGHFRGEIASEGHVLVAEHGEVEAEIHAKVVTVTGKVKGSVFAFDRLEIQGNGAVLGDVHTPVLLVEPGSYLDGRCHMLPPGPDEKDASVRMLDGAGDSASSKNL